MITNFGYHLAPVVLYQSDYAIKLLLTLSMLCQPSICYIIVPADTNGEERFRLWADRWNALTEEQRHEYNVRASSQPRVMGSDELLEMLVYAVSMNVLI